MKIKCTACGKESSVKGVSQGSAIFEVFLWLFFLIPGIFYSLWRVSKTLYICPFCTSSITERLGEDDIDFQQKQRKVLGVMIMLISLAVLVAIIV